MTDLVSLRSQAAPRAADDDEFRGRIGRTRGATGRGTSGALGARLSKALAGKRIGGSAHGHASERSRAFGGDSRQRVVAKVSFHNHAGGGGGGGKLLAHLQYLERDGAAREGERGRFYDREHELVEDAREQLREWEIDDRRHFRIMLAPESGLRFDGDDLKGFTRDVMERMERDLGVGLHWVAVDHHNTDTPHVHVIVRGVRRDGAELLLPREYVSHGLREAARDIATGWIGERSLADERLRLEREVEGRSLNRLDRALELELNERREVRLQEIGRDHAPEFANSMRARARKLQRLGLAEETRRNVLRLERNWLERLEAARPLDIRRELARGRLYEPRLGRVMGEVLELGPRGDNPDRALLVIETPDRGRFLLNTGMREIEDLQQGSLVALKPHGRSAEIERLSYHRVREQVRARADTVLDQELDRVARGEARRLPPMKSIEAALVERAELLEANGLGVRSESGKFYFRDGARERLREAELERAGQERAREHGGRYRDLSRDGQEGLTDKGAWKVREVRELFAGKTAMLERGRDIAAVPMGKSRDIGVGDEVMLKAVEGPARTRSIEISRELAKGLQRGIGRGLGLEL